MDTLGFISSVQSFSVTLRPHVQQHTWLPCPSATPRACSNSCPLSQWCQDRGRISAKGWTLLTGQVPWEYSIQQKEDHQRPPWLHEFWWSGGSRNGVTSVTWSDLGRGQTERLEARRIIVLWKSIAEKGNRKMGYFGFISDIFKDFFKCGTLLKALLDLLQYHLFYILFFGPKACRNLSSPSRDQTRNPCSGRQS